MIFCTTYLARTRGEKMTRVLSKCWFSYGAGADGYPSDQQRMSYAYEGGHLKCVCPVMI